MPSNSFQQGADQGTDNQDQDGQGNSFSDQNPGDNQDKGSNGVNNPSISAEDLAVLQKRDVNAQSHISTLENEAKDLNTRMVEMQEKLDKAASVEDLLKDQGQSTFDVDELTAKVTQNVTEGLSAEAKEAKAKGNFDNVATALTEKHGDKTDDAVKKACQENDMTFEDMVELARKNPKLAMKLCDVEVKPDQQPSRTSINSSALLDQNQQEPTPKANVMDLRTDKARIEYMNQRLDAKYKELNL